MDVYMDYSGWELEPVGGDTGQAYKGTKDQERVFLKRNSSPFLAALSAEGITPKLIWTKRVGNGDVITAQEWLTGRVLSSDEMSSTEVINLLQQIHHSATLYNMLTRISCEEYIPERFLVEYFEDLHVALRENYFLNTVVDYLSENLPFVSKGDMTVCHGDLNRRNFFKEDNGRLYLVDWEMVRLAEPLSDLTMVMVQYIEPSQWNEWLECYGVKFSKNVHHRVKWYSLMNCLFLIKKNYYEEKFQEMNQKITLAKYILANY
ncbi:Thiamine kinase [Granulicatella balaenopterae]|uniref:Thiamine kinase n=1 Tax=Granulicatella balaenopterae TaxID=137733 RepID=A0A1H9MYM4_9LACT|nr:phosphotransferase family protein [Granulicatella balaenopterae]SER28203.1 Thiamine kinase [Granulicatella balaenopterae]